MTPQMDILAGHLVYWDDEGWLCMNPFYKADEAVVEKDMNKARKIYDHIFFGQYLATALTFGDVPPRNWGTLEV